MNFIEWAGSPEGVRAAAGTLGGIVISAFNWEGPFLTLRKVMIGAAMAYALGPTGVLLMRRGLAAIGVDEMPSNADFAVAFLFGVFGMVIIETGARLFRAYRVRRQFGGKHDVRDV